MDFWTVLGNLLLLRGARLGYLAYWSSTVGRDSITVRCWILDLVLDRTIRVHWRSERAAYPNPYPYGVRTPAQVFHAASECSHDDVCD